MSWQNKLYGTSPTWVQNLAISAFGYQWKRRRFGGVFAEQVKLFKEREAFTKGEWYDYQTQELRKLLVHAFETVPFYKEKYTRHGFSVDNLRKFELDQLARLPFLTKDELRQFGTSSLISAKRQPGGSFFSSSGSTGTPVKILYSNTFHQKISAAMEARVRNWAGVNKSTPRGMIGGRRIIPNANNKEPFYRYNCFEKQTYFSAYHISKNNALNYLKGMRENEVSYMTGYAISNYLLATFFKELGVHPPKLEAVITSSEKLTSNMRKSFEEVYGCKTFDSYSGVENCALISEHYSGDLIINNDVGIIETIDENGIPTGSEGEFEIACTGLLNYDQPLIRYRIGDCISRKKRGGNKSGLELPTVASITGRIEDIVTTYDGKKMVRFHSVFIDLPEITEAQVIQHTFTTFTVKLVCNKKCQETTLKQIVERMTSQLGDVKINVLEVESIPRTKAGKLRAVVSEIK